MEGGPWAADAAVRPSVSTRLGFSEGRGAKTAMIQSNKSFGHVFSSQTENNLQRILL